MGEQTKTSAPFPERLTLRRVANGWIVQAAAAGDEFTHVHTTPDQLAEHVKKWAAAVERNEQPFRTNDRD